MAAGRKTIVWTGLLGALFAAWFFTADDPRGTLQNLADEVRRPFSDTSSPSEFEVFDTSVVPPERGTSMIRGSIRNLTDRRFRVVRVQFDLLDENGEKVGNAFKYMNYFAAGETRAFEVPTRGASFSSVRLTEARGW